MSSMKAATPKYIIIKLLKNNDKKKILKVAEKTPLLTEEHKITADNSLEIMQARHSGATPLKYRKKKQST